MDFLIVTKRLQRLLKMLTSQNLVYLYALRGASSFVLPYHIIFIYYLSSYYIYIFISSYFVLLIFILLYLIILISL